MSRMDCNTTRVYTTKILIVSIATREEKKGGEELIGSNENKGNITKDYMKNYIIRKIEWKVELLFVASFMEMKGDSTTSSSSSITTSNYPPITLTYKFCKLRCHY